MVITRHLILATILGVLGVYQPVLAADEPTAWDTDYTRIRQNATDKNRPILLSVGSASCGWCTKLHATAFRDRHVATLLDREFITGKIDANHYPELVRALRIEGYPTIVIAAPDGKILQVVEGYQTAEQMTRVLHRVEQLLREHREQMSLAQGTKPK